MLLEFVEADYPLSALAEKREGRVVLRLTIDESGNVLEVTVQEPAGHGFDEAALAAAEGFRFAPAKRGGTPVSSRILYAYEFQLPEPPPTGAVRGRVTMPGNGRRPAVGVEVILTNEAGQTFTTRTGEDGRFELEGIPPGLHRLSASSRGVGEAELELAVAAGEISEPTLRLLSAEAQRPIEVTVRGRSKAERLRRSAEAVQVIETEQAQRRTADLGEVLARVQGVGVRRGGGLGSGTRFSLNGLTDDQIRFFLDGIPLELAGYPFGIANVPVNLVERVDVYRGVVPIRFGADALGGAVNLATSDDVVGTRGSASYETGSFGTHRLALGGHHLHEPSGFFTRAAAFLDVADNDYPVDVEVPDSRGRLSPARAYRFHDGYRATGGNVEVGFVERPWADRLILRGFVTDYDKELQNNVVMTVPYGEVQFGELSAGGTLRYEHRVTDTVSIDLLGGYAYTLVEFLDVGSCVYNWFGQCVRERRQPGEIESRPRDQLLWQHDAFGRLNLGWQLHPEHAVRLSVSPTLTTRTGDERRQADPNARDPLTAQRDLLTLVSGLEYEADLFDGRLENILFAKSYYQVARSEEPLPGGTFRARDRDTHLVGAGNALRYRFLEGLYAKISYEWATRLPRPDEVFGDGVLIIDNLELEPETSHNVNLGITLDARETGSGDFRVDVNGFLREAEQLIVLLGNDRVFTYQNVFGARSFGVEGALGWTSPGEYFVLDGNVTYLDFRNTSSEGTFGDFEGDRIPNRPYFFANGSARVQVRGVARKEDELSLSWNTRFVHQFFRGWESVGLREFKQFVPDQLLHALALTYFLRSDPVALSFTVEGQNITDEQAFDFFGVQRPGRAVFFKTTAEF